MTEDDEMGRDRKEKGKKQSLTLIGSSCFMLRSYLHADCNDAPLLRPWE